MKTLIILTSFFLIGSAQAKQKTNLLNNKTITVAVIDTGYDFDSNWSEHTSKYDDDGFLLRKPKICKQGNTDFTGEGLKDFHGHGTHVAGIIAKFAEDADYCLVILKYFKDDKEDSMLLSIMALKKAIDLKVDIINYSSGGMGRNDLECKLVKQALNSGIHIVVAAGNQGSNINKYPYFPAMCDDRIVAVKNIDNRGNLEIKSNFTDSKKGSRELMGERGTRVLSLLPDNKIGIMTGTSQAAPAYTGKLIKKMKMK